MYNRPFDGRHESLESRQVSLDAKAQLMLVGLGLSTLCMFVRCAVIYTSMTSKRLKILSVLSTELSNSQAVGMVESSLPKGISVRINHLHCDFSLTLGWVSGVGCRNGGYRTVCSKSISSREINQQTISPRKAV